MAYQTGHYYYTCNYNNCSVATFWFPDGSGDLRNQITAEYWYWFNRYGEQTGVEGHVKNWQNNGPQRFGTIRNMVYIGGDSTQGGSGEIQDVNSLGKHCGMTTGSCPPLPSATISASPSSIIFPESSTISWTTSGVTSVSITNIGTNLPTSGSRTVSPSSSTTYTLTGTGPRGTVTRSVTVSVTYQPPSATISASPSTIIFPGSSTISWSTFNATSVSITNIGTNLPTSGSRTVSPSATTTYTLTATGPGGSVTRSATVTVAYKAPSATISASPSTIIFPGSSTISWTTSDATSVSITNIGTNLATSGSRTVSPSATTTYTLTATGLGGSVTRSATVTVTYQPPSVSFSLSSSSICRGSSATLSWNVTGQVDSVSINQGIGTVAASGSRTVRPTSSTTYVITATGPGGTTTRSVILTVNQPTTTSITADSTAIIRGQSTTLRWTTTGDATGASISPGIGTVNINGNRSITPSETTRYTINVTGICTNSTSSVTVTVYQPPTVTLTGPASLNYGQQGTLTYTATNADISLRITPTYNYRGSSVTGTVVNLPIGPSVSGTIQIQIPYNNFGPFSVRYVIVATGNGGQETKQITFPINVDETPDNFLVPESTDLLKSQDPIFTPDKVVTSYKIKIDDIDIPVEIKADKPILVDKNEQQNWNKIRKI